jgi:hypothetical protein
VRNMKAKILFMGIDVLHMHLDDELLLDELDDDELEDEEDELDDDELLLELLDDEDELEDEELQTYHIISVYMY